MAASNRQRKLLQDSTNGTAGLQICIIQCDPQLNPTGVCIRICSVICPSICRIIESSAPPSSSPSPSPSPPTTSPDSPSPSTPTYHHHSSFSLPLKISIVFIVAAFVYTFYKFYIVWYRSRCRRPTPPPFPEYQQTHDQNDDLDHPIWYIRTTGLQPSVINAITVVNFSKSDGVVEGTCCSVCLSEFEEDDTLRLLPNCKHAFHISCIDTWLRSHTNCPLCRAGITGNSVDTPSPEQSSDDLGLARDTLLGISTTRDVDRGEASGSSGLRIGDTDEEHRNTTSPKIHGL